MAQKSGPTVYPKDMQRLTQSGAKPSQDPSKKPNPFERVMAATNNTTSPTMNFQGSQQSSQIDKSSSSYPKLYDFNPRNNQQSTANVFSSLSQSQAPFSSNKNQMVPTTTFQQFSQPQPYTQTYPVQQQFPQSQPYQQQVQQPSQFQQFQFQQYQPTQQVQYPAPQQLQPTLKNQQVWSLPMTNANLIDNDGDELLKDVFLSTTGGQQNKTETKMSFSDPSNFFNQANKFPPGRNQTSSYFSDTSMTQEIDFSLLGQIDTSKSQINQLKNAEDGGSEGSEESTSIFNSNTSKGSSHVAEIIEAISQSTHGASKYLHEVCDKMGKKGPSCEYIRESIEGQSLFVATVTLEGFTSTKTGRSKQDAKNAGSLEVLRKLIENNDIAESSLKMILFKGKKKMTRSQEIKESVEKKATKVDLSAPGKVMAVDNQFSAANTIDQLTELGKINNFQIGYEETTDQGNFEITIHIANAFPIKGYGKTKIEAKQVAAQKALNFLQTNKEFKEKYMKTSEQKNSKKNVNFNDSIFSSEFSTATQETSIFGARPSILDGFLQASYYSDLQNEITIFPSQTEQAKDSFEAYLQNQNPLLLKHEEETLSQFSRSIIDMFKRCLDVKFIAKNSAKIHDNALKVVEAIKGFHFFPLGSFVFSQLRKDHKTLDFNFIYEMGRIKNLPEIPVDAFFKCILQILEADNVNKELEIKLNDSDQLAGSPRPKYLTIRSCSSGFNMRIFGIKTDITNPKDPFAPLTSKYHPTVIHVTQTDKALKFQEDRRSYFNKLCGFLKTWRRKNDLTEDLPSEILETLCLNYAINYETNSLAVGITQILSNLLYREHAFKVLKGFSEHWQEIYLKLDSKNYEKISKVCKSTLDLIAQDKFAQASF